MPTQPQKQCAVFAAGDPVATRHFAEYGWVVTAPFDDAQVAAIRSAVDEIAAWPDDGDGWLHYRELTDHGPRLCRTENFVPFHAELGALLTDGPMLTVASALLGEPAVLYKEKINYKLAGGAGYAPHQDGLAYRFVDALVSCQIAVDAASLDNGCLEVVSGMHHEVLATDDRECIAPEVVASLDWTPVEVQPGHAVWFHSLTPHRSGPNATERDRRALYPTYNARSAGDLRAAYYARKQAEFADGTARAADVPVSLIGDFQGRPVPR
ncbi:MAG TPA: phytanoyl-CoA dioxygenase family protein [Acidimicrobiia bacterium]